MRFLIVLFSLLILGCKTATTGKMKLSFDRISETFPPQAFENVKHFILAKGNKKTYRNFDSNNPHYQFKEFEVFLASDIGQKNINNNPELSDFNQMTLVDRVGEDPRYVELIIVRAGDIGGNKFGLRNGMKEGEVYLVDVYDNGIAALKEKLIPMLRKLQAETGSF